MTRRHPNRRQPPLVTITIPCQDGHPLVHARQRLDGGDGSPHLHLDNNCRRHEREVAPDGKVTHRFYCRACGGRINVEHAEDRLCATLAAEAERLRNVLRCGQ